MSVQIEVEECFSDNQHLLPQTGSGRFALTSTSAWSILALEIRMQLSTGAIEGGFRSSMPH